MNAAVVRRYGKTTKSVGTLILIYGINDLNIYNVGTLLSTKKH